MPLWVSTYPVALDVFTGSPQVDLVDIVWANNVNIPATSIEAIEAKLGITAGTATGFGGVSFDAAGKAAFPGGAGDPTIWVDNSGGPGFVLTYTDELGIDYPLFYDSTVGVNYNVADPLIAVGDLVSIDPLGAVNDVVRADSATAYAMHGLVIDIHGGGLLCDILYSGEVQNAAWTGLFPQGTPIYVGAAGVTSGMALVPTGGVGSIQQEVGFFRNADTFVIRPSLVTYI